MPPDSAGYHRFNRRVRGAFLALIPVHGAWILLSALLDEAWTAGAAHLAMAGIAFWIARSSYDAVRTIIFSHVYWTFSFTTYLYAALHLQGPTHGLGTPGGSALIALTSQTGLAAAYILSRILAHRPAAARPPDLDIGRFAAPLLAVGWAGVLCRLAGVASEAVAAFLLGFLTIGLAVRIAGSGRPALRDPAVLAAFAGLAVLSVAGNERADLMSLLLFLVFAVLVQPRRVASLPTLAAGYLGWRLLTAFSAVALSIRWARDTDASVPRLFAEGFFSPATLWTVLNPFHVHEADRLAAALAQTSGFYSDFYVGGAPGDLLARLALLPQMDIVTARIGAVTAVRWDELWTIFLSALPSLGQEKDLIFSDRVVWDLGLRSLDTLGRPMITAEGELYALGGLLLVATVIPACFLLLDLGYRLIRTVSGSQVCAILLMSQIFVGTIFSTTALGVFAGCLRAPLQLVLVFAVLRVLAGPRRVAHASGLRLGRAPG